MHVQLEIWQLILLLIAFFGCVAGFGKLLLAQFERRLDDRFTAQEEKRSESQKHWDTKFTSLENSAKDEAKEWIRIERDLFKLKADLPVLYVRREDYIRNQSVLEAKLDAVAVSIGMIQKKGNGND